MNTADVMINYTNWRGIRASRRIQPLNLFFDSNEYHPELQWLLDAIDRETESRRTFALSNIHSWRQIKSTV